VFNALEKDAPDLMKQNMGKKVKNLNTTIVSPLTVLDNMYVQSARTPEEIAIISQSNEWDAVMERMKVGKSKGIRHQPFVHRLEQGPVESAKVQEIVEETGNVETEKTGSDSKKKDSLSSPSSHESSIHSPVPEESIVLSPEEKEQRVISPVLEESSLSDLSVPSLSVLETVDHMISKDIEEEEEEEERVSIQEKMNGLTRKMIQKEKETKKIVSDAKMVGFDLMMKASVLEGLMFFWLEAIQMRPGEEIRKSGQNGRLYTVNTNSIIWNQDEVFSLCSQLVSLQEKRNIYRTQINGLTVREILEQNPSFGEPCDMVHDDSFFRPAVGSERPCCFGNECFLYSLGQSTVFPDTLNRVVNETAFPGREFYRPEEVRRYCNRRWPTRRRTCLMCYEMAMMYLFLFYRRDNRDPPFVIQNHWNKIEGENAYTHARMYPLEDNEKRWTGFVLPKVMRCPTSLRASKTVVKVNGELKKVPCWVQASQNFR
jgi:hypothetical protein